MTLLILAFGSFGLSMLVAAMFLGNSRRFEFPDRSDTADPQTGVAGEVSVLIPARDEAAGIGHCIAAALASIDVIVQVIVLDDDSSDGTGDIVRRIGRDDDRVVCRSGAALPAGWNGKQHACWQLAAAASYDRLVFLDADVRLEPDALALLIRRQDRTGVALLSAFPRQITGTFWEHLIIPMMHYILLGFLPFSRMRSSTHPAYASGCGQLFMTRKSDYQAAGTHAAIGQSRHDGVKLPRAYREAGLMTDVVDGSKLARCRMYTRAGEVVRGVLKNATEGIANPRLIVPFTVMILGAGVLPFVVLVWAAIANQPIVVGVAAVSCVLAWVPRGIAAVRYRQSWWGVVFHPAAAVVFVALQWVALVNHLRGRQIAWRGRVEQP